ncbi:DAO domain-containing protein [Mycena kentingensis (nom. inval.)]|nr:DAO domain-containing protein [Mycena kentingensis (nom. inval.)]
MSATRLAALCTLLSLLVFGAALPQQQQQLSTSAHAYPTAGLPHADPTRSFWVHSPNANRLATEGSTGPLTDAADVCIIGSGITGGSAAWHLARAVRNGRFGKGKVRAVVLEARDFSSGATGRNGGNLTPYEYQNFVKMQERFGSAEALRHYAVEDFSATEMVRIAREGGWADAVDVVEGGHIDVILTEERLADLQANVAAVKAAGREANVTWLSREEMNKTYGTYNWGLRSRGYNFWPLKFVNELFLEANATTPRLDLRLHTHTPVTKVFPSTSDDARWELQSPRGAIQCGSVLHATNGYASHLLPQYAGPEGIVPVRGQVIATRASAPLSALTKASWAGNSGYWFPRPVSSPSEHPLIVLGGAREDADPPFEVDTTDDSVLNSKVGKSLRAFLPALFPRYYDPETEPHMEWTGIMGYTALDVPFVGRVPGLRGQYISAGYAGHGMPRAYACAKVAIEMIVAAAAGRTYYPPPWFPRSFMTVDA